jgi:hypothetical protein
MNTHQRPLAGFEERLLAELKDRLKHDRVSPSSRTRGRARFPSASPRPLNHERDAGPRTWATSRRWGNGRIEL